MTGSTILAIVLALIGSSGVASIVTALLNRRWKKQDEAEAKKCVTPEMVEAMTRKLDAVVTSQKVITTERIRYLGGCYIYAGEITLEDKETLHQMHEAYEGLGGNGHLDTVMAEVDKLRVVRGREKVVDDA